jgi:hypothetical protein
VLRVENGCASIPIFEINHPSLQEHAMILPPEDAGGLPYATPKHISGTLDEY